MTLANRDDDAAGSAADTVDATRIDELRDVFVWDPQELTGDTVSDAVRDAWCNLGTSQVVPIEQTGLGDWLIELLRHVHTTHARETDFRITFRYDDRIFLFRGHRDPTADGRTLLALRRIPNEVLPLKDLRMPPWWHKFLMQPVLKRSGGLVLVAGTVGSGKTTTIGSTIVSRLEELGGHARTVEDPVELPLQGAWGQGVCIQTPVSLTDPNGWAVALKGLLRAYPACADGGTMLYVGEVRDPEVAAELLRAAMNGHLVFTTIHASSVISAVARLSALAAALVGPANAADMVAASLRLVIHQRLNPGTSTASGAGWNTRKLDGDILVSEGDASPVANTIRSQEFHKLKEALQRTSAAARSLDHKTDSVETFHKKLAGSSS